MWPGRLSWPSTPRDARCFSRESSCASPCWGCSRWGSRSCTGWRSAASIGVLFTMVAALTFLPAMLGFIGPRVLSRRQRRSLASEGPRSPMDKGFWVRWSDAVARRPLVYGAVALVIICALALPFFSLRLGSATKGTTRRGQRPGPPTTFWHGGSDRGSTGRFRWWHRRRTLPRPRRSRSSPRQSRRSPVWRP